jgi:hypothetical protein
MLILPNRKFRRGSAYWLCQGLYIPKIHASLEGFVALFDFVVIQGFDAVDAKILHVEGSHEGAHDDGLLETLIIEGKPLDNIIS